MRIIKVTDKTTTDCVDSSYCFLDINVLSEGKKLTLIIEGEIYTKHKKHEGTLMTPGYDELLSVEAVCTSLNIYDEDINQVRHFNTEFSEESETILNLLKTYCYEN